MTRLEKAQYAINSLGKGRGVALSALSLLVVTLLYLLAVLSVPLHSPQKLVWLAIYPVIQSEASGLGFGFILKKSLWLIPLLLLIGIFNPILNNATAFTIGGFAISEGWVSCLSILIRGLLALQAALILTYSVGFYDVCHSLRHLGCPKILIVQLMFTYRYMGLIVEEAINMDRARKARGFGRKNYPLSMWGRMVGQLLIRSYDRAGSIHRAMLARGFTGNMPAGKAHNLDKRSIAFIFAWSVVIAILRFADLSGVINHLLVR
ncbi:MAG: energy-coupling factor transporter transmembrane protein EcfT [Muribaculaceae bacterium]|nr:energy-coupling factor transporter transmembrane protein EcfT [Muribaculaceae bacterium]